MSIQLNGSRVFISAGGAGIGRAMVKVFHAAGARIYTCDIDGDAIASLSKEYPDIIAVTRDCADWGAAQSMFAEVEEKFGGLDVLINNVGIAGPTERVEDIDIADWARTMDVNITAHFYCAKLATPMLKRNPGGAMINVSSAAGQHAFPLRLPYSATKWGVIGFTKTLAAELGPSKIRVNAICPGLVEGPRIDAVIQAKADANNVSFDEIREKLVSAISMRTGVEGEDIANMALFLASDLAHKISGQAIAVDGHVQMIS